MNNVPYDAAGHQQVVNGNTLSYDAENRQTQEYDNYRKTQTAYAYDGDGNRVQTLGPAGATVYVYDAFDQLTAEYSTTGQPAPCQTCYLSTDHLGSVRLVTDQSGAVVARHDYLPFGEEIAPNTVGRTSPFGANDNVSQRFTGKERDGESGLDYFGARYYGSALGRFTSPDKPFADQHPKDPQSWNLYAYVRNNPLAAIDDTGRACSALNSSSGFCQRADLYGNLDSLVGAKTRFFAAASAATQAIANVDVLGLGRLGASSTTRNFLEQTGQSLQSLNIETAGKILSGQITMSGTDLDSAMVRKEQTKSKRRFRNS